MGGEQAQLEARMACCRSMIGATLSMQLYVMGRSVNQKHAKANLEASCWSVEPALYTLLFVAGNSIGIDGLRSQLQ